MFLKILQISQESTCARVSFFNKAAGRAYNFFKKETLVQLFSCEFCESFKASLFTKQLWLLLIFIKPTIHFLIFFLMFTNKTCSLLNIFQNLAEKLPGNNYSFEQVLLLVKSFLTQMRTANFKEFIPSFKKHNEYFFKMIFKTTTAWNVFE